MIADPGSGTPAIDDERLMLGHTNPQTSCCPKRNMKAGRSYLSPLPANRTINLKADGDNRLAAGCIGVRATRDNARGSILPCNG